MALKSDKLFEMLKGHLEANGKDLVGKVKHSYRFVISETKTSTPK